MIEATNKIQWQSVKNQYLATGVGKLNVNINRYECRMEIFLMPFLFTSIVNLAIMGYGAFEGWTSPSIISLTSPNTLFPSGQISIEQASWLASVHCIGGLFGNIMFGYIINRYGRRLPLILITFPIIVSV